MGQLLRKIQFGLFWRDLWKQKQSLLPHRLFTEYTNALKSFWSDFHIKQAHFLSENQLLLLKLYIIVSDKITAHLKGKNLWICNAYSHVIKHVILIVCSSCSFIWPPKSVPVLRVELYESKVVVSPHDGLSPLPQRICRHQHPQWLLRAFPQMKLKTKRPQFAIKRSTIFFCISHLKSRMKQCLQSSAKLICSSVINH